MLNKLKNTKRFVEVPFAGKGLSIIKDTKTGVQYLFKFMGNGAGLTLLVDRDGKPLLDSEEKKSITDFE